MPGSERGQSGVKERERERKRGGGTGESVCAEDSVSSKMSVCLYSVYPCAPVCLQLCLRLRA